MTKANQIPKIWAFELAFGFWQFGGLEIGACEVGS
jgi:hypothetical protein